MTSNRDLSFEYKVIALAPVLCIMCANFATLAFLFQVKKSRLVSRSIIAFLEEQLKKSPQNPIINLLVKNQDSIIKNIEQSYIFNKIVLYVALLFSALFLGIVGYLTYQAKDFKKNDRNFKEIDKKQNAIAFAVLFFATSIILLGSLLIPLFTVLPEKVSDFLCKGIEASSNFDNAMTEVFKSIVVHTFKEERIISSFKKDALYVLSICSAVCFLSFCCFLALGFLHYTQPKNECKLTSVDEAENAAAQQTHHCQ